MLSLTPIQISSLYPLSHGDPPRILQNWSISPSCVQPPLGHRNPNTAEDTEDILQHTISLTVFMAAPKVQWKTTAANRNVNTLNVNIDINDEILYIIQRCGLVGVSVVA